MIPEFEIQTRNIKPLSRYEYVANPERNDPTSGVKNQAFAFMGKLNGWCSTQKASILIDLIFKTHPETIVEIGVFGGSSLIPMAYALKVQGKGKIFGIDPWNAAASLQGTTDRNEKHFWGLVDYEAILRDLNEKIDEFALSNQIELIRSTSAEALPIQSIDLLHIDGNHSEEASYIDVTKWVPLMKRGGWILFDDITWHNRLGVFTTAKAVEWLDQNCMRLAQFNDVGESNWGFWIKP